MRASSLSILGLVTGTTARGVWTTPHDKYSSSVGVLGCKINTNRVAYWPGSIDCDNICVKLSYKGRSVHLLRIDTSGGAYDISYDAWAYLQTGNSAAHDPISGGSVAMDYEEVDASECADLIYTKGSKLPLSASNSINYLSSCLDQPNSWVAKNHVLFNICDAICSVGFDEECQLDLSTSNQPSCPHTLGLTSKLTSAPVYDIEYSTGRKLVAGSGEEAPAGSQEEQPKEDSHPKEDGHPKEAIDRPVAPTVSPTTTHQTSTTPSASATVNGDNGAIFQELTSTSEEAVVTSDAPSSTGVTSTILMVTTSSRQTVMTSESQTSLAQLPTSSPVSSIMTSNTTASYSITSSHSLPSSTKVLTTLTVSTVSAGRNPSSTSKPSTQETPQPESAGRPTATISILAMALGIFLSLSSLV